MSKAADDRYHRRPVRLDRLFANLSSFYFVTFNTAGRQPFLGQPEIDHVFREFCLAAAERHNVSVGRYVLMPDHIHLFVAFPAESLTLSRWVQALRSVLGKELLRLGAQKPHWQEGFFDHLLRSGDSYDQKWEYVRMNPVRAGLCVGPDDWPYQGEIVSLTY
jgi:REP element-mobilizing transposase RayT